MRFVNFQWGLPLHRTCAQVKTLSTASAMLPLCCYHSPLSSSRLLVYVRWPHLMFVTIYLSLQPKKTYIIKFCCFSLWPETIIIVIITVQLWTKNIARTRHIHRKMSLLFKHAVLTYLQPSPSMVKNSSKFRHDFAM